MNSSYGIVVIQRKTYSREVVRVWVVLIILHRILFFCLLRGEIKGLGALSHKKGKSMNKFPPPFSPPVCLPGNTPGAASFRSLFQRRLRRVGRPVRQPVGEDPDRRRHLEGERADPGERQLHEEGGPAFLRRVDLADVNAAALVAQGVALVGPANG